MPKIEIRIKLISNMLSKTIEVRDTDNITNIEDDITTAASELLFSNAQIERILIPE